MDSRTNRSILIDDSRYTTDRDANPDMLARASLGLSRLYQLHESLSIRCKQFRDAAERKNYIHDTLITLRQSDYYRSIKMQLAEHKQVCRSEYAYYLLITDDINHLDLDALKCLRDTYDDIQTHTMMHNLRVLIAIREFQCATDHDSKSTLEGDLREALIKFEEHMSLLYSEYPTVSYHCGYLLNLHGVNLEGADLSSLRFRFVNLIEANLTNTTLIDVEFIDCCLDSATLNQTELHRLTFENGHRVGLRAKLERSTARNANFANAGACVLRLDSADITGAQLDQTEISVIRLRSSCMDYAKLRHGKIEQDPEIHDLPSSASHVNLLESSFIFNYASIDLNGATLFPLDALNDEIQFYQALQNAHRHAVTNIERKFGYQHSTESSLAFSRQLAMNIVFHLNDSTLSLDQKLSVLDQAIRHPIYTTNTDANRTGIWNVKSSVATKILVDAKNELLAEIDAKNQDFFAYML